MTQPTLDAFTRGYLEAALWTTDPDPRPGEWTEREDWCIARIYPPSLERAIEDCRLFQVDNAEDLATVKTFAGATDARNGQDFWLTRNRHGAGFWDRGYGDVGQLLTDAAHVYGSADVLGPDVADNGRATDEMIAAWDGVIYLQQ